jgi:hypothetical protein
MGWSLCRRTLRDPEWAFSADMQEKWFLPHGTLLYRTLLMHDYALLPVLYALCKT